MASVKLLAMGRGGKGEGDTRVMIHYHGLPITPVEAFNVVITRRHAMVSFAKKSPLADAAEIAQSFALDNGAFSHWRRGLASDWPAYYAWVERWMNHPGFDWAIIPDIIDGDEEQNDAMLSEWPFGKFRGVPVWHLHESLERLYRLAENYPRVALGSSGEYRNPGTSKWWGRISEAMKVVCDHEGFPMVKLHGLRMLDSTLLSHLPLSSADSTNVGRNANPSSRTKRTGRSEADMSPVHRALTAANRVEFHAVAQRWTGSCGVQKNLELVG